MFDIGEAVVYGNKGVCTVSKIGPIDIPGSSPEKAYYTLTQVGTRGGKIFTPVETEESVLRKVITKDEAEKLINDISSIHPVWIQDDKEREKKFTTTLREANVNSLAEMIVMLHNRKERRIADGKKPTSTDERYSHSAEDSLCNELAFVLNTEKLEIKKQIINKIENK